MPYRLYVAALKEEQPNIEDAEVDAKLEKDFASLFEEYVSIHTYIDYIYIYTNMYKLSIFL